MLAETDGNADVAAACRSVWKDNINSVFRGPFFVFLWHLFRMHYTIRLAPSHDQRRYDQRYKRNKGKACQ